MELTDRDGMSVEVQRFTWEGRAYFDAIYGNAQLALPFEKIASMSIIPAVEGRVSRSALQVQVQFHDGNSVEVRMDRRSKCYGEIAFGEYEIFLKEVTRLEFRP